MSETDRVRLQMALKFCEAIREMGKAMDRRKKWTLVIEWRFAPQRESASGCQPSRIRGSI
jgi:hypothetical protein